MALSADTEYSELRFEEIQMQRRLICLQRS